VGKCSATSLAQAKALQVSLVVSESTMDARAVSFLLGLERQPLAEEIPALQGGEDVKISLPTLHVAWCMARLFPGRRPVIATVAFTLSPTMTEAAKGELDSRSRAASLAVLDSRRRAVTPTSGPSRQMTLSIA
jgi:hypothetical protein